MPDDIKLHQGCWIVIPKGIGETGKLRVTVQWVPHESAQMLASSWPAIASTTQLGFYVRAATKNVASADGTAGLTPDYVAKRPWPHGPNEALWKAAFADRSSLYHYPKVDRSPNNAKTGASVTTSWQTTLLLNALDRVSSVMTTAHQHVMNTRAAGKSRMPMQVALSGRSILFDTTGIGAQGNTFDAAVMVNALSGDNTLGLMARTIRGTYLPNEMSAEELRRWVGPSAQAKAEQKDSTSALFSQLQAAYRSTAPDSNKGAGAAPQSWQAMAAEHASSGIGYDQLLSIANGLTTPAKPEIRWTDTSNAAQIVLDEAIVGLAPWRRTIAPESADTLPSALSMVGQAFTLQMQLGMLTDLDLPIEDLPAARDALAGGRAFEIAVQPTFVPSDPVLWTRVDASGWPADDPADDGYIAISAGLLDMTGASLTNIELRQSYQQLVSEVKAVSSRLDFALQAPNKASQTPDQAKRDTAFLAKVKTGPLALHMSGMARHTAAQHDRNEKTKNQQRETVFTLQTLLIGVRPDLRIAYPGQDGSKSKWRALMTRNIKYVLPGTTLPAATGEAADARTEGYIPLTRLSAALTDSWVADDELFTWSGWNSAIPLPGDDTSGKADHSELHPEASAIPGSNPAFRYGSQVKARARVVLRDGTCLPVDDHDTAALKRAIAGGDGDGFAVRRYEPLKAPAVLMARAPQTSDWLPPESLTRVVLGTSNSLSLQSRLHTVRYWLPGEIKDLFELDRHGQFDTGRTPLDTAFAGYERVGAGFPVVDAPDPPVKPVNPAGNTTSTMQRPAATSKLPVFRRGINTNEHSYYPDPLVDGLVVALGRKADDGQWWPIVHDGSVMCCVHHFYPGERQWPEAVALRIEFDGVATDSGPALRYRRLTAEPEEALLHVAVPAGERFSLIAWPIGDPGRLGRRHAYGTLAGDCWKTLLENTSDHQDKLLFPPEGISGLLSETSVIDVEHFVVKPQAPGITHEDITKVYQRQAGALQQPYAVQLTALPGAVGGMDVVARWVDPVDDPLLGAPRYPQAVDPDYATTPGVAQAAVATVTSDWHVVIDQALSDPSVNSLSRPAIPLPAQPSSETPCWLQGQYALPDGKHRYVRYVPIAHSALPDPASGPLVNAAARTHEGAGILVNVLASVAPAVPVVRDVLPSFRFCRQRAPSLVQSERQTAITLLLERGWWSSGDGEMLGVYVRHDGANAGRNGQAALTNVSDASASAVPTAVSSWGADAALSVNGGLNEQLQASHFQSYETPTPVANVVVDGGQVDLVLYTPTFDASNDAWRVDIQLNIPAGVTQPFVQFAIARFQPDAIPAAQRSPVTLVDFIQWQDQRFVTVMPEIGNLNLYNVAVWGPQLDAETLASRELVLHLEVAAPGQGPVIWQRSGQPIHLTGIVDEHLGFSVWRTQLALDRLERFERTRVCLMEQGRFVSGFAAASDKAPGPLYFMERVEFGDDLQRESGQP